MAFSNQEQPSQSQPPQLPNPGKLIAAAITWGCFALGIPGGTAIYLNRFVLTHLVGSALLLLAWEVAVFSFTTFVSLSNSVRDELIKRWSPDMADVIDRLVRGIFAHDRHRKKYYEHLKQHNKLDFKGLGGSSSSIKLDQGFVDVYLKPTEIRKASLNPLAAPLVKRADLQSPPINDNMRLWDYLANSDRDKPLLIVASSGRGKTTLLQHITMTLITRTRTYKHYCKKMGYPVPLFLSLRAVADSIGERNLVDAFKAEVKSDSLAGWMKSQLEKKNCLVMLDGLDEIPDEDTRKNVEVWIQTQIKDKDYGGNRFIITSRPFSSPDIDIPANVLTICSFSRFQISSLVHKWYLAYATFELPKEKRTEVLRVAQESANNLLQELDNTAVLQDLAANPLLLTLIVLVYRSSGILPGSRAELYRRICDACFGKRQESKNQKPRGKGQPFQLQPHQVEEILRPLGYHMMKQQILEISSAEAQRLVETEGKLAYYPVQMSAETFLQYVETVSGLLLLDRETGQYQFAHKAFQEYLAAANIKEAKGQELVDLLKAYIKSEQEEQDAAKRAENRRNLEWWRDTIRIYCGLTEGTEIIKLCLSDQTLEDLLYLAYDCLAMNDKVAPEIREELQRRESQDMDEENIHRQRQMGGVLLRRNLHETLRLSDGLYIRMSLIKNAEYQVFLDGQCSHGCHIPDHWKGERFERGQGNAPTLGVRLSDARAFCKWLTDRQNDHWLYRLPQSDEVISVSPQLEEQTGYWLADTAYSHQKKESGVLDWRQVQRIMASPQHFRWSHDSVTLPVQVLRNYWDHDNDDRYLKDTLIQESRLLHPTTHLDLDGLLDRLETFDPDLKKKLEPSLNSRVAILAGSGESILDFRDQRGVIFKHLCRDSRDLPYKAKGLMTLPHSIGEFVLKSVGAMPEGDIYQKLAVYIDAYVSLVLLEERRKTGRVRPCEGILVVKELKE